MSDIAIPRLIEAVGLTTHEYEQISTQAQAIARGLVPYTRLIDRMTDSVLQREQEIHARLESGASQHSRQLKALREVMQDNSALLRAQENFANPCIATDLPISDWLRTRYEHDWTMTPSGEAAKAALTAKITDLIQAALEKLAEKRHSPAPQSITQALRDAGFKLLPRLPGSKNAHFVGDGLGISLHLGRLSAKGEHIDDPKSLTIEHLSTHKEMMRVAGLRHTLGTLMNACDMLGMSLHIKPFPIDLGENLKPLDGEPLLALYKNLGFEMDGEVLNRTPRHELDLHKLLNLGSTPTSDQELEEQAHHFRQALQGAYDESGFRMHHLFDEPQEIVRTENKVSEFVSENGWLTPAQAKAKVQEWKDHALEQGASGINSDKVVISLFDLTGEWSKPWREAGYDVYQFDIQAGDGVDTLGINTGDVTNFNTEFFNEIFASFDGKHIHAVLAANPCTDFASSGARHFAGKDANGTTSFSVELVKMSLAVIEYFKPSVWAIENPTGRIERLVGLPQWSVSFDPYHFGEDYTKRTMLWGRMNGHMPIAPCEPVEGSKMHRLYGGKSIATKNARSATPEGFSYAFFMANNAVDNPLLAIGGKYDRLDKGLIQQAIISGLSEAEIDSLVEDHYFFSIDDDAAHQALAEAIGYAAPQASLFIAHDTFLPTNTDGQEPLKEEECYSSLDYQR